LSPPKIEGLPLERPDRAAADYLSVYSGVCSPVDAPSSPVNAAGRPLIDPSGLRGGGALSPFRSRSARHRQNTRTDLNPINPCGACMEWLRKISEKEPGFRVITFDTTNCENIYVKRIEQL